ncbi:protein DEHYDRATION-INDUCED 19-like isoform X2 [Andrographis paniculata]|uniref:protein DEHYDRATION-INDUCED 19-like isoform X2 n=1 Tax=Andrographis paniculata TaxID=175694 RepID=UPI0021E8B37F|nr:protein DEHYDRATION-INDUCED 19-like isoform X2 [Andrographis paniculata]
MDSDFWMTRLAAAKRQLNMQSGNHVGHSAASSQLDELDVEDEIRSDYPCPYCYSEFDIGSLCSHLEDDHSCESKPAVCPICSVKIARDMLSHIMLQHGHLLKRHRRVRKAPIPTSQALSLLGRDLRDAHLQVLLGGSRSNNSTATTAITDGFFSSLISTLSASETDDISKSVMSSFDENSSKNAPSDHIWTSSLLSSLTHEEREQRIKQATRRAIFVQDLLASTLWFD